MNFFYSSHLKYTFCLTISFVVTVLALSDVNKDCISRNNGTTSNDFLLGTWYKIYEFSHVGRHPTCSCPSVIFTKPTDEELIKYKEGFSSVDLPHAIGDDAVVLDRVFAKGLVLGGAETKTYIIDPKSIVKSYPDGYEVHVYRRINDKYMLHWWCDMLHQVQWLLTRDQNAPEEEMQEIIRNRPEIIYKENGIRFCNGTCNRF